MFYVYLLNSSTKKARSKYETNKKKTSYDFSVSLCIKYLLPTFYNELSNLYLRNEIRLSIRYGHMDYSNIFSAMRQLLYQEKYLL